MSSLNLDFGDFDRNISVMSYPMLADAKVKIEASLDALFSLLQDVYKFDMELPLTRDGFPRNDIDVVSIRLVRTKIIRLRNDLQRVMHRLGSLLSEQLQANLQNPAFTPEAYQAPKKDRFARVPFAVIRAVNANSPAQQAGLKIGDRITIFDEDINATNNNKLTEIARRVKDKEEEHVEVVILRDTSVLTLDLVPTSKWEGKGLLGCHVVPL